ncbi:MAG: bifunctional phosphoribosylaminoimidazolecarboxamide formyltransferase/IMP cyclohydrolase [Alphaproteobacteria bacterium]|nr:bifunctional phosphoribosylaminoimidazolecarboxamide formyltransferase/IMP cyclohydrolase [Alphaproteobacteria bacterium]
MPNNTDAQITRAIVSVSDKSGLTDLGQALARHNIEILSTGGSAQALIDADIPVIEVADHTGFPEIMDGRVKTLHPKIHGGILARRDHPEDQAAMEAHGISPIDLIVINLYPFEATVASGAGYDDCVENIDIGGPAMIRAAAKNHAHVAVVTDPSDYDAIVAALDTNSGKLPSDLRRHLATKAYARTAAYDGAITSWLSRELNRGFPETHVASGKLDSILRYGENPHQTAALYIGGDKRPGVAHAEQIQGKELSYNNLGDADAAFELAAEFDAPAISIIKHANPCGVAIGDDLVGAYRAARKCDPVSSFGGIVAANRTLTGALAEAITEIFTEVVIAPDADDAARAVFATKENLRVLLTGSMPDPLATGHIIKPLAGGFLLQDRDTGHITAEDLKIVTKRQPSEQEIADMLLAFTIGKHVKSNTIVYAKDGATVGIGAGQMSRVDAARIAAHKSKDAAEAAGETEPLTKGSVAASDAFFPFADGLLTTIEAGATAVIQPGGSIRDDEVIAAADEAGIAMVFTGMRHFRH